MGLLTLWQAQDRGKGDKEEENSKAKATAVEHQDPGRANNSSNEPTQAQEQTSGWRKLLGRHVSDTQQAVDSNQLLFRMSFGLLLATAFALTINSSGLLHRFDRVEDIPMWWFVRHKKLRARLIRQSRRDPNIFYVYHTPFLRRLALRDTMPPTSSLLLEEDHQFPYEDPRAPFNQNSEFPYSPLATANDPNAAFTRPTSSIMSSITGGMPASTMNDDPSGASALPSSSSPSLDDSPKLLAIRLFGVQVDETAEEFVYSNFLSSHRFITLQLLRRIVPADSFEGDQAIATCRVWFGRPPLRYDLAREIVSSGYGECLLQEDIDQLDVESESEKQRLMQELEKLKRCEENAQVMRYGIWKDWQEENLRDRMLAASKRVTKRSLMGIADKIRDRLT